MLVVLASRHDEGARFLVERWRRHHARLLTCEGLSRQGWVWHPDHPERSRMVFPNGESRALDWVRGVVSLLPAVGPDELPHIAPIEREYVASEMMAFLVGWISSQTCTVANRPTPLSLVGPAWRREQWLCAARKAGLAIRPSERNAPRHVDAGIVPSSPGGTPFASSLEQTNEWRGTSVAVIGAQCMTLGDDLHVPEAIAVGLQRIATSTGMRWLTARFHRDGDKLLFADATPTVDVTNERVCDAMLDLMVGP